jgi:aromatic-L-amino-acid decarboxylase
VKREPTRRELTAALEWVLSYLDSVRNYPVLAQVAPGDIESRLPKDPPRSPEPIDQILDDVDQILMPGVTHWNHPRFFGYFPISSRVPGIAGELLTAALNVNAMLWRTSPAASELEWVATRWLARMIGLPEWFATINDTASTSTLYALTAARHAANPEIRSRGMAGAPQLAVYASEEAHSSVDKAVHTIGIGLDNLRRIPTDTEFRMDVKALEAAIEEDVSRGVLPAAVVATVGTTSTTSVDPVREIAVVCERYGCWLHIDAAYAGIAAALPELRWILEGAERADSFVVNPHKWLFVPIDCSVLYLREPDRTREAFSVVPEYLRTPEPVRNLMDYGISLGRRFRALKLWMVIRSVGTEGIVAAVRDHISLANLLGSFVHEDPDFEILAPYPFSVVNFRFAPAGVRESDLDGLNARLAETVNASGEAFITTTIIRERLALHVAIGNLGTTEEDVRALWQLIRKAAASL